MKLNIEHLSPEELENAIEKIEKGIENGSISHGALFVTLAYMYMRRTYGDKELNLYYAEEILENYLKNNHSGERNGEKALFLQELGNVYVYQYNESLKSNPYSITGEQKISLKRFMLPSAIKKFEEAYEIFDELNLKEHSATTCTSLASAYNTNRNKIKAKFYYLKAIQYYKEQSNFSKINSLIPLKNSIYE